MFIFRTPVHKFAPFSYFPPLSQFHFPPSEGLGVSQLHACVAAVPTAAHPKHQFFMHFRTFYRLRRYESWLALPT
jgi:hypothetical protein